jgi:peptidoglycan/LPS O-acetylase OafA/YrhL
MVGPLTARKRRDAPWWWRRLLDDVWVRPARNLPALDGLRAFACASIVFFHCAVFTGVFAEGAPSLERRVLRVLANGAWSGVDVFFVLSGFLIGRILVTQLVRDGGIGWRGFYLRRVLRIFPAYYLVLTVAVWVLARFDVGNLLFFTGARSWRELAAGVWTDYLFVGNYVAPTRPNVMSWAWSLCVEEHFYLVLPALLALTFRARTVGARLALLGLWTALPIAGRLVQLQLDPATLADRTFYYQSHNRFDQLLIGVLVAACEVLARERLAGAVRRLGAWTGVGGLVLIAVVWLRGGLHRVDPFTVVLQFPLMAAGTALLLVNGLFLDNPLSRFFAHRGWYPLARVSYGTYLIHPYVLFWAIRTASTRLGVEAVDAPVLALLFVTVLGLSAAVATLMFSVLERPLLDLGARLARRPRR